MRNTVQRKIILEAVQKMHSHPTAEEVYREIQKEHSSISKATVYRNLHYLTKNGEIQSILAPNSPEIFDYRLSRHYHFCCKTCGGILDVDIDYMTEINAMIQNMYGFKVDGHDIVFNGICLKCQSEGVSTL